MYVAAAATATAAADATAERHHQPQPQPQPEINRAELGQLPAGPSPTNNRHVAPSNGPIVDEQVVSQITEKLERRKADLETMSDPFFGCPAQQLDSLRQDIEELEQRLARALAGS